VPNAKCSYSPICDAAMTKCRLVPREAYRYETQLAGASIFSFTKRTAVSRRIKCNCIQVRAATTWWCRPKEHTDRGNPAAVALFLDSLSLHHPGHRRSTSPLSNSPCLHPLWLPRLRPRCPRRPRRPRPPRRRLRLSPRAWPSSSTRRPRSPLRLSSWTAWYVHLCSLWSCSGLSFLRCEGCFEDHQARRRCAARNWPTPRPRSRWRTRDLQLLPAPTRVRR
jgi:hypothetical protein